MLQFYFARGTCSLATHIALLEAKLPFEGIELDFAADEQRSSRFLELNPKGRVPALVTARGVLTETPAILAYISSIAPWCDLAPSDDPFLAAKANSFNSYLCSTVHVAHSHRMRGSRWADEPSSFEDMKRKVPRAMAECFELIEQRMFEGPWVHGSQYSISDPYLFAVARWLEGDGVECRRFPKVLAHRARMVARPAILEALHQAGEPVPPLYDPAVSA